MAEIEAYGAAQKDFFITMLTRDITLADCILDLLDNCIDGATRELQRRRVGITNPRRFQGYEARIEFDRDSFTVRDNCGGIPVRVAKDYAFAFGRREGAPEYRHSIGLYGIGMKRAIFKMGDLIDIASTGHEESFVTKIDVPKWRAKVDDWSFILNTGRGADKTGTEITVSRLHDDVALDFNDAGFKSELEHTIARDYMFILRKGFSIRVNGSLVRPLSIKLLSGGGYVPLRQRHKIAVEGARHIDFEIIAGLWKRANSEDDDPESSQAIDSGWYVVCNDRVVLPADRTSRTGWEVERYIEQKWHSQYKPFIGFAMFSSDDPSTLPWTTTKRGVDQNSEVYRQALSLMADATSPAITYTNTRKANRTKAEVAEEATNQIFLLDLPLKTKMSFPKFKSTTETLASISYQVLDKRLRRVKINMGNPTMLNRDVGLETFEYYYRNAMDE